MAQIPDTIKRLVDTFERNFDLFKSGSINETQLRREYLDPFFTSLGWDVENKQGYADAYKDVIHEYSLKTKDVREAPDYCFRIGGTRKFFVEAKKPSVNVKEDIHPAYQLRSYAWSAKLPLSILTDFEEFAVYDCRILPNKKDKASTARILFFTFQEYLTRWNEIEEIFARESILKGSFDKYVETNKKKKGTAEVDEVFLEQMEEWRKSLAKNIAVRNPKLNIRELNFAVQKTIDRIIFLRICEDRGIEDYGQLMTLQNGTNVYERLKQVYHRADEKYNSGLFHFEVEKERNEPPDEITLSLKIDDKTIKDIVRELYYPDSPYEFSVLPADILGQVYEQFLGKVIRLTSAHHAVVDDKPEVKKAGGVYYTPTYIVDYIVKNTLGKLLTPPVSSPLAKGRTKEGFPTPKEVSNIKVLDPACGSGSFLLGAYQYLLDWHLKYYTSSEEIIKKYSEIKRQPIYRNDRGNYLLTTSEKKRILLNNIYGVDIDQQAVEVTKLSLMLKVLEGESTETLSNELKFFRERALPDLSNNIKCGNSLIGPDFYDQMEMNFLDDEEKLRINVFDWKKEFKEIMDDGGFDVVIGNPPYVRQEFLGDFKEYFQSSYEVYNGMADIYSYFIEKGIQLLNKNGLFGIIVANKWMRSNYGFRLRDYVSKKQIVEIIDFKDLPVFGKVSAYPCILIVGGKETNDEFFATSIDDLSKLDLHSFVINNRNQIKRSKLDLNAWNLEKENIIEILNKMKISSLDLVDYIPKKLFVGIKTGLNEAFVIDEERANEFYKESNQLIKKYVVGRNIKRYEIMQDYKYLILIPNGWSKQNGINSFDDFSKKFPLISSHLRQYESNAKKRTDKGEFWWELRPCSYYDEFDKSKIVFSEIALRGQFTLDDNQFYSDMTTFIIPSNSLFLLGVLNSKLVTFYFKFISSEIRGNYLRWKRQYVERIPICVEKGLIKDYSSLKNLIEEKVTLILELHRRIPSFRTPAERTALERQIEATDKQIDQLVYQLYGLTEEEIKIVEGKN